jgi:hypothetical protein
MSNHFGAALGRFLQGSGMSLRQAGEVLDQFHTVLSTTIAGSTPMSAKNLSAILHNIQKRHQRFSLTAAEGKGAALRLHAAWLEDFILPEYAGLVGVVARQAPPAPATDPRAAAIEYFDQASQETPEVADWLIASRKLMGDDRKSKRTRK